MVFLLTGSIIVELFVADLVFCSHAGRFDPKRLWLPIVACVGFAAARGAQLSSLSLVPKLDIVSASLYYVTAFVVSTIAFGYVMRLGTLEALVVGALGYCVQHFWSDMATLVLGPNASASLPTLAYYLLHVAILAAGYVVTYAVVGRHFAIDEKVIHHRAPWVVGSVLAIFFVIVFSMMFADAQEGMARVVCYVYDALVTALIMLCLIMGSRVDGLRSTLSKQEALWEQKRKQFELTRESMDLINLKCHDIRKKVNAMGRAASLSPESLHEMSESIRVYDAGVKTGNDALDVVLTQKSLLCSQRGIEFDCMADGRALDFMSDDDLYFLMANVLDNAIEAVLGLDDTSKRSIDLTLRSVGSNASGSGGFAVLREDNYFAGDLVLADDGLPKTTKGDISNHGFGTRSIKRCVEQYGGEMSIQAEDGVFSLSITIPRP